VYLYCSTGFLRTPPAFIQNRAQTRMKKWLFAQVCGKYRSFCTFCIFLQRNGRYFYASFYRRLFAWFLYSAKDALKRHPEYFKQHMDDKAIF
jgi:hypothetical protein